MAASTNHPSFPQPPDGSARIWRYIDFAKLVAMLESRALHFTRVDTLLERDPFEGTLSREEFEHWQALARDAHARHPNPSPEFQGAFLDAMLSGARDHRWQTYVNCWYMSPDESEAMWRLYASSGYAVAIQSEYRLLVSALPSARFEESFVGVVRYVDHDAPELRLDNGFNPVMRKRKAFAHENEARAVVWRPPLAVPIDSNDARWPSGLQLAVELPQLVQRIVVSPLAPTWFAPLVGTLTARCGLAAPVEPSQLLARPYI